MTHPHRPTPCPWPNFCGCTHTGGCVAGWIERQDTPDVTSPCPNCRPDLFREMNARHHARGDNTTWVRTMNRPITSTWIRS